MRTFLNLFGRSPFTPLQTHMQNVAACVNLIPELFEAVEMGDYQRVQIIAAAMSEHEHQADITKNDIRNHLPKSLFLPIDRNQLLEILSTQDQIADKSEDVAVLVSLKPLVLFDSFKDQFKLFLQKNIESFYEAQKIIQELHELLESSFGGLEAERVKSMVDTVSYKEHEADLIQRDLLRHFFATEKDLTIVTFDLWQRIFECVGSISNLSEHLANRVRMTLEIK
ncbi:MAG: TIGR00153 family protein [Parachlamydiaceae bacterium]